MQHSDCHPAGRFGRLSGAAAQQLFLFPDEPRGGRHLHRLPHRGGAADFGQKNPRKTKEEDSLYQMKFTLSSPSPIVQQGQQLYLRPTMGLDKEQIGVTNDKGECLGFVPGEYREYILSRHRSTPDDPHHRRSGGRWPAGNQTVSIKIIC